MGPGRDQVDGHHKLAWELACQVRDDEAAKDPEALGWAASSLPGAHGDDDVVAVLATYAWHLRELAADSLGLDDYQALDQRLCEQAAHSHLSHPGVGAS